MAEKILFDDVNSRSEQFLSIFVALLLAREGRLKVRTALGVNGALGLDEQDVLRDLVRTRGIVAENHTPGRLPPRLRLHLAEHVRAAPWLLLDYNGATQR